MQPTRPDKSFKKGKVNAAIWVKDLDTYPYFSISFSRPMRQKGKTEYRRTFDSTDLPDLVAVIAETSRWILEKEAEFADAA